LDYIANQLGYMPKEQVASAFMIIAILIVFMLFCALILVVHYESEINHLKKELKRERKNSSHE